MATREAAPKIPDFFRFMLGMMMLAAALPLVASAWLPTDNQTQLMISLCAVIAIVVAKPFAESMPVRLFIMTVAGVIVMRYWMWRVTTTLPDTSNIPAFVIGLMLFAVETYSVVYFFLTSMMMADPIDHELPPHVAPADLPTVTVLIPSYNEPSDMLRITVAAACNMLYPSDKLQVVLCDDGGTDQKCNDENPLKALAAQQRRSELMQLCHELGASYSTRSKNIDAKAGNMRAAMASTESDLIVVFDADHVPSSDFLARTVGYFKNDPKLFLVQTPHFFLNDDPVHRNLQLPLNCPPENEMFYSKIHRGLDRWEGAFFCGSAAVLRRKALDDVGGFSGDTITEDAETALEIHSRGWRSMYLNQAMIAGLQPETFSSFIQQRGRWAAGMMQLFVMKNPIMRRGLKFSQKVCYFNSMTYWFFPIIRGIFMVAPLVYLFFGLEIFVADFQSALSYTTGYLAVSLLMQNTLFSRDRWPLVSEIYEVAQTPYLLRAVLGAIFNPKSFSFKVTDKSETVDRDYISPIYGPLLATLGLMGAGWAALAVRWVLWPGQQPVLLVVGGWLTYNTVLVVLSCRAVFERRQRRSAPRVSLNTEAKVFLEQTGDYRFQGVVRDVSITGAMIAIDVPTRLKRFKLFEKGAVLKFEPELVNRTVQSATVTCRIQNMREDKNETLVGVQFNDSTVTASNTLASLIFDNSNLWRTVRLGRGRKTLLPGLWFILWRAIKAVPNSLRDVVRELQTYVPTGVRPTEAEAEHLRNFGRAMAVDAERAKEEEMELDSVIVLLERGRAASGAAS